MVKHCSCSHEGCTNQAQKGGVCITHGAKKKIASTRGAPTKSKGEAFASRMAQKRNVAARGVQQANSIGVVCCIHGVNSPSTSLHKVNDAVVLEEGEEDEGEGEDEDEDEPLPPPPQPTSVQSPLPGGGGDGDDGDRW